jgi:hypothetical protein
MPQPNDQFNLAAQMQPQQNTGTQPTPEQLASDPQLRSANRATWDKVLDRIVNEPEARNFFRDSALLLAGGQGIARSFAGALDTMSKNREMQREVEARERAEDLERQKFGLSAAQAASANTRVDREFGLAERQLGLETRRQQSAETQNVIGNEIDRERLRIDEMRARATAGYYSSLLSAAQKSGRQDLIKSMWDQAEMLIGKAPEFDPMLGMTREQYEKDLLQYQRDLYRTLDDLHSALPPNEQEIIGSVIVNLDRARGTPDPEQPIAAPSGAANARTTPLPPEPAVVRGTPLTEAEVAAQAGIERPVTPQQTRTPTTRGQVGSPATAEATAGRQIAAVNNVIAKAEDDLHRFRARSTERFQRASPVELRARITQTLQELAEVQRDPSISPETIDQINQLRVEYQTWLNEVGQTP